MLNVAAFFAACLCLTILIGEVPAEDDAAWTTRIGEEVPATANDLVEMRAQNSPTLATDPTDSSFVALAHRIDAPRFGCSLQLSDDGGSTWFPADPAPRLPKGVDNCYSPEIVFDNGGTLYYLFAGLSGPGNQPVGVYLTRSNDRGRTFTDPKQVLGPHNYQVRMGIDRDFGPQGRLHVVWLEARGEPTRGGLPAPPNPIMATHSDDGGKSFSDPVRVSEPARDLVVAPGLAVGSNGKLHVVYYDLKDDERDYYGLEGPVWGGTWSLVAATSDEGGTNFEGSRVIDDDVVPPDRVLLIFTMPPAAVATDDDDRVFAAWHEGPNDDWDVSFSRSVNGGRSWEGPTRLHSGNRENHQYLPQLSASPDGRVDAIFYDRSADSKNRDNHVSYTWSHDAGVGFAGKRRLTSEPTDSRIGRRYAVSSAQGRGDIGSRLGLVSFGENTVAAWTDTRNAPTSPYQDIFAVQVVHGSRGLLSRKAVLGGGLLVGVVGVIVLIWALRVRRAS